VKRAEEKVLSMFSEGQLSARQADELLRAMRPKPPPLWLDPFQRLGTRRALGVGVIVMLLSTALSHWQVRFNGAFGVELVEVIPSWGQLMADAVAAWPLVAACFWLGAWLAGGHPRWVDCLGIVGLARAPLVAFGLGLRLMIDDPVEYKRRSRTENLDLGMLVAALPGWVAFCCCVFWLFRGFQRMSPDKGARRALSFMATLLAAEIISVGALLVVRRMIE
jgi:hypothetical protein